MRSGWGVWFLDGAGFGFSGLRMLAGPPIVVGLAPNKKIILLNRRNFCKFVSWNPLPRVEDKLHM
jgi:hypothetical protein